MLNLEGVSKHESPQWLKDLAQSNTMPAALPLEDILTSSVYYPGSGTDGFPIKCLSHYAASYVYADYGVDRKRYFEDLEAHPLSGYELKMQRDVTKEDLVPAEWRPPMPSRREGNLKALDERQAEALKNGLFGHWTIWHRRWQGEAHGPEYLSLLFISGEGAAVYHGLYVVHSIAPRFLAIIQSDAGMAQNWTRFGAPGGFLHRVAGMNPAGMPEHYMYGEYGDFPMEYHWPEYSRLLHRTQITKVDKNREKYNPPYRHIAVWGR